MPPKCRETKERLMLFLDLEKRVGLNRKKLGELLNISPNTINFYATGRCPIPDRVFECLQKLDTVLNVDPYNMWTAYKRHYKTGKKAAKYAEMG